MKHKTLKEYIKIHVGISDNAWKNIGIVLMYILSVCIIVFLGKYFIQLPFRLIQEYNVEEQNIEKMLNLYSGNYGNLVMGIILLAVLFIPAYILINKIKSIYKQGENIHIGMIQSEEKVISANDGKYTEKAIENIINSKDTEESIKPKEEKIIDESVNNRDNTIEILKCKTISSKMLPVTMAVTRIIYNVCKEDVRYETVLHYTNEINKQRKRKKDEEWNSRNEKIAKSIIDFLNKNGIIEADEGMEERYYFTHLGNLFMQYYIMGII